MCFPMVELTNCQIDEFIKLPTLSLKIFTASKIYKYGFF